MVTLPSPTMDVIFETCTKNRFTIEIGFFDTVLEMKQKIQKYQGYPVAKQKLIFNGRTMADEHDTEFYEVLQGSHIHILLEPDPGKPTKTEDSSSSSSSCPAKFQIFVKGPARSFSMEITAADTVGHVKEMIHRMEGVSMSRTFLAGPGGQEMEEHRSIAEYGICDCSEISVCVKAAQRLSLMVKTSGGEVKMVEMKTTDKVEDVRKELQRVHQIPPEDDYFFVHQQSVMDENRSLRRQEVQNGDVLYIFNGKVSGGS